MNNLNSTVSAERLHIGFFGCRNAGKSSVVNAVTGQSLAVVSDRKGTTTDPVQKAMELAALGPVVIIDTAGFDDEGDLGSLRVAKTREALRRTDIAVLVVDGSVGLTDFDHRFLAEIRKAALPHIICFNKLDLLENPPAPKEGEIYVSAATGEGIEELKNAIIRLKPAAPERPIMSDLIEAGDSVLLVIPIDASAPKGRLILPQQLVLREILDKGGIALCCQPSELTATLQNLKTPPKLVIADSQVFRTAREKVPEDVNLTSFSILMARHKGTLQDAIRAAEVIKELRHGDRILIAEGCTHHRQCEDIGTVKIPMWLREYTGKDLTLDFTSGREFPESLENYRLVIHCGGCTLNEKEMAHRLSTAKGQGVPFCNYGIFIAAVNGIIDRSTNFLPEYN